MRNIKIPPPPPPVRKPVVPGPSLTSVFSNLMFGSTMRTNYSFALTVSAEVKDSSTILAALEKVRYAYSAYCSFDLVHTNTSFPYVYFCSLMYGEWFSTSFPSPYAAISCPITAGFCSLCFTRGAAAMLRFL